MRTILSVLSLILQVRSNDDPFDLWNSISMNTWAKLKDQFFARPYTQTPSLLENLYKFMVSFEKNQSKTTKILSKYPWSLCFLRALVGPLSANIFLTTLRSNSNSSFADQEIIKLLEHCEYLVSLPESSKAAMESFIIMKDSLKDLDESKNIVKFDPDPYLDLLLQKESEPNIYFDLSFEKLHSTHDRILFLIDKHNLKKLDDRMTKVDDASQKPIVKSDHKRILDDDNFKNTTEFLYPPPKKIKQELEEELKPRNPLATNPKILAISEPDFNYQSIISIFDQWVHFATINSPKEFGSWIRELIVENYPSKVKRVLEEVIVRFLCENTIMTSIILEPIVGLMDKYVRIKELQINDVPAPFNSFLNLFDTLRDKFHLNSVSGAQEKKYHECLAILKYFTSENKNGECTAIIVDSLILAGENFQKLYFRWLLDLIDSSKKGQPQNLKFSGQSDEQLHRIWTDKSSSKLLSVSVPLFLSTRETANNETVVLDVRIL
ncbi:hypothetical protein HK096_008984, partial [Nowakowskiella sp. JEL0078]